VTPQKLWPKANAQPGTRHEAAELVNPDIGLRSPAIQFGDSVTTQFEV